MSDTKDVALVPYADFTIKDLEAINKFKEDGMLGLHTLVESDVERCMALYLDGKSYRQVAHIVKVRKDVVLFLAQKFSWWELRREYLDELHATMKDKVLESKLQTQEFLFDLIVAYRKKIGKNLNKYLKTDDELWMDKLDSKDMGVVFKCVELLHRLNAETYTNPNDKSMVSLNGLADGVTITKTGANSVEITPKSPFASKLKQFADLKRQQEKENQPVSKETHDIIVEQSLTEKKEENNET